MSWQDEFREWFPITRDKAYANIAYTSPLAPKVADGVAAFFDGITHARSDKPQWLRDAGALRARLARLIGGDARRLAFTKNTTEGLNTVAQGLAWQEGDNLVVDDQEHPTNALPWLNLRRRGVQVRVPSARAHRYTVDDLWQHVDARTRLIAVSWVQYGTGLRTDIAELGRRWRTWPAKAWWPASWSMVTCACPSAPITIMGTSTASCAPRAGSPPDPITDNAFRGAPHDRTEEARVAAGNHCRAWRLQARPDHARRGRADLPDRGLRL
ncbi:aminotransferase class V-fold PLP-dependent enzyme [Achromobacter xylosoxidans]|uniref:aminotransferase class V-fold PLP-dependent enzyme n=1 Tax=Alcaligenes xylosoxydans xylosoxydans TaxID=85698 RepID=UPI001F3303D1|nr:aminotransferase class V-fold PLP-dependent enzyme [Achromobacter xylosoxidans]